MSPLVLLIVNAAVTVVVAMIVSRRTARALRTSVVCAATGCAPATEDSAMMSAARRTNSSESQRELGREYRVFTGVGEHDRAVAARREPAERERLLQGRFRIQKPALLSRVRAQRPLFIVHLDPEGGSIGALALVLHFQLERLGAVGVGEELRVCKAHPARSGVADVRRDLDRVANDGADADLWTSCRRAPRFGWSAFDHDGAPVRADQ